VRSKTNIVSQLKKTINVKIPVGGRGGEWIAAPFDPLLPYYTYLLAPDELDFQPRCCSQKYARWEHIPFLNYSNAKKTLKTNRGGCSPDRAPT